VSLDGDLIAVFEKDRSHLTDRRVAGLDHPAAIIDQKVLDALLQL
jgi:hypothetical protein